MVKKRPNGGRSERVLFFPHTRERANGARKAGHRPSTVTTPTGARIRPRVAMK
jgi:hypothetical protein